MTCHPWIRSEDERRQTSDRHRLGHHRCVDCLAPDQSGRPGNGRRRQRGRGCRDAQFLCLDQCQLGQSGALFPAAQPRHGRMVSVGERPARPAAQLVRRPVLGSFGGGYGNLCRGAFSLGLRHRARRPCRRGAHRAESRRTAGFRFACRRGRCCRAGRSHQGPAGRCRTARRAHPFQYGHGADPDQWQDNRRGHIAWADCRRRGGDRGRRRLAGHCRDRRHQPADRDPARPDRPFAAIQEAAQRTGAGRAAAHAPDGGRPHHRRLGLRRRRSGDGCQSHRPRVVRGHESHVARQRRT